MDFDKPNRAKPDVEQNAENCLQANVRQWTGTLEEKPRGTSEDSKTKNFAKAQIIQRF